MRILISLLFLFTGTAMAQTTKKTIELTTKENGKTIHVKKGAGFSVKFNQCVGCASVYKITKIDSIRIKYLKSTYSNRSCTNCTGGTVDISFLFKAIKSGKSVLRFRYFSEEVSYTILIDK